MCVNVCMYVCVCVRVCVRASTSERLCHMRVCGLACVCMCVYMCVCQVVSLVCILGRVAVYGHAKSADGGLLLFVLQAVMCL